MLLLAFRILGFMVEAQRQPQKETEASRARRLQAGMPPLTFREDLETESSRDHCNENTNIHWYPSLFLTIIN